MSQDLVLLERIARRETAAVGELYDRHGRVLFGLICRILRDEGDAEDVLQEVFLRVWDKAETYDAVLGTPLAWLVRIARNRAIDRLRARHARPSWNADDAPLAGIPADPDRTPGPDRLAALGEQQRAIVAALQQLPREQRLLIEEAFFGGYTQSELATKHQLPLGTVKTRIRTGMMAMRELLQHVV